MLKCTHSVSTNSTFKLNTCILNVKCYTILFRVKRERDEIKNDLSESITDVSFPVAACYCSRAVLWKNGWEQLATAAFAEDQGYKSLEAVVVVCFSSSTGTLGNISAHNRKVLFVACFFFLFVCLFICLFLLSKGWFSLTKGFESGICKDCINALNYVLIMFTICSFYMISDSCFSSLFP